MNLIMLIIILVLVSLYFILFHSPLIIMFLEVEGQSMYPTFKNHETLVAVRTYLLPHKLAVGDVIVANPRVLRSNGNSHLVIKRIAKKMGKHYFITGDNAGVSYDSRDYGWLSQNEIVAKVITRRRAENEGA